MSRRNRPRPGTTAWCCTPTRTVVAGRCPVGCRRRSVRRRSPQRWTRRRSRWPPTTAAPLPQRQAEALAEICGYVLDHGARPGAGPGGDRPHLTVQVRLEDLQARARAAMLDFGGASRPAAADVGLRRPGDPGRTGRGRATAGHRPGHPHRPGRAAPRGRRPRPRLRCTRAAPARPLVRDPPHGPHGSRRRAHVDRQPASCCAATTTGSSTAPAGLCRIRDGHPEFIPPAWIDPQQRPRRRPSPHLARADFAPAG